MKHALIALAGGSGLVGIDSGDHDDLIGDLVCHLPQAGNIFHNRLSVVRRARADDQHKFVGAALKDSLNRGILFLLRLKHLLCQGEFLLDFLGDREFALKIHTHNCTPQLFYFCI